MPNSYSIRPFEIDDIYKIKVRKEQSEFYAIDMDLTEYGKMIYNGYQPLTLVDKHGKIVWIVGIQPLSNHTAEAYFLTGEGFREAFEESPIFFIKSLRKGIQHAPFGRVQVWCNVDFPEAEKLILLLGFIYEGTLRKASVEKKDIKIFSVVKDV